MTKFTLNIEEDYDFSLIGISCHAKDFRLCFELNKLLEINLTRVKDLEIMLYSNILIKIIFLDYYLISNRGEKGFLIPEHKTIDFLLQLKGAQ